MTRFGAVGLTKVFPNYPKATADSNAGETHPLVLRGAFD